MKIKITFELDLADTDYNIPSKKLIPACLQNIGSWFNGLHLHYLDRAIGILVSSKNYKKQLRDAIIRVNKQHQALSSQLFNNYKVEGVTEDGNAFTFTHTEPGYKEEIVYERVLSQATPESR